ncbi:MAG: DUF2813 domain-containing protein [Planctomycetes bacterium]|nr:DUF2813 domain-containing protein [Planctomycetota bacterium]
MIRRLTIENYRCLRAVTMNLEPLTVLVGANGTGKSSVFAALGSSFSPVDRWARDATVTVRVHAEHATGRADERHVPQSGQKWEGTRDFPHAMVLQLDLQLIRQANQLQEMRQLATNGYGVANVFGTLTRKEQDEIARQFCTLVPLFADVAVRPHAAGNHRVVFQDRWHPTLWYEPHQVSDGSILLLAFLLLPYQSPPPDVIAIEEPERGLHPYLMGQLVGALRRLANGELGPRPVQVLLATHSAELLEFVEPREVRFFNRSKDTGETIVREAPVDDPSWKQTLREYDDSLGDLWLSGGLGGVPGR